MLEANPRASRTVPIVSKVCGLSMARLATQVILGKSVADLGLQDRRIPHYGVKESVFPFNMFPEVDPVLGPEMRSTGEVLGLSYSFGRAFFKAQEATQTTLPLTGTVLFTIADRDKNAAIDCRVTGDPGRNVPSANPPVTPVPANQSMSPQKGSAPGTSTNGPIGGAACGDREISAV